MTARTITECQICGDKHLESIIHLGWHPPVNNYHPIGQLPASETFYPLHLVKCASRGHVQIDCQVDPQVLFPSSYPYRSRTTKVLQDNFEDLVKECCECFELGILRSTEDLVIDIGSNDGTLLSYFRNAGVRVYGIDPALEAAQDAKKKHDINTVVGYFSESLADGLACEGAALVTACNVFAHVPDVHDFMRGVDTLLAPDGVFISESHYLSSLLETCQYDTIYHEHLRYYSLGAISDILEQHGFSIFHAKKIPTHGGSIRVYASREKRDKTAQHDALLIRENQLLTAKSLSLKWFAQRAATSKVRFLEALFDAYPPTIYGIGAPSRASTLVNYCGLDDGILDCIVEIEGSPKIGKYMPGTTIPVVDEKELYEKQPPYALILSWHIADEIMENLRKRGYKGKFIVPLPEVRII